MHIDKLTPSVKREFELLTFVAEKVQSGGALEEVKDLLYNHETIEVYSRIANGENVLEDHTLPDAFLMGHISETQFKATKLWLSDLKGRREHLKEIEEKVFNFDNSYAAVNKSQTWDEIRKLGMDKVLNNPRGFFPDCWGKFFSTVGGLSAGELIGIAGGSGASKTTMAIEILHRLQTKYNCKTGFISCEMSPEALSKKIVKRAKGLSSKDLVWTVHNQMKQIEDHDYGNWSNCIFDHSIFTLKGLVAFVRREKPKFFALDYVGMIHKEQGYSSGDWSVHLTNSIKELCKETGSVCIALFQLDKSAQKKDANGKQHIPSLADIYGGIGNKQALDSGMIVYKVGNQFFTYWDKVRDVYDNRYLGAHFEVIGDAETGVIHDLELKSESYN